MKKIFIATVLCLWFVMAQAQMPLIDRGLQVNGLWCFPLYQDTLTYVYLPYEATLARDAAGLPQFSYMRYVMTNARAGEGSASSIQQGDGGAILNFLVLYNTPPEVVQEAQTMLRKRVENDSVRIRGPLVLDRGRYSLVSSLISGDSAVKKSQVLSVGNAPVFENNRIALSFGLTPATSMILSENFKMNTPDISMVFDMEFSGLTENYDAELEINWSEIKNHQSFRAGGSIYFVSADLKMAFDELMKTQAVKLTVTGTDTNMEALLNTVYDKLLALLFEPVQPEQLPEKAQGSMLTAIAESITGANGILSSKNTTGFGANIGYQLKEMKTSGKSVLRFKGRNTVQRHHFITFNIGNLHKQYGDNAAVFRDVPLADETFMQRSIMVGIDGDLEKEFEHMLNSVTVILSKQHVNRDETVRNIVITAQNAKDKNKIPLLVYGYHQDTTKWLEYRYRTVWQFRGGATFESDWKTQDASMINLYVPYKRRSIDLEGDLEALRERGIRALSVQIDYPFFSLRKNERITINTSGEPAKRAFSITQPNDNDEIDYNITWIRNGGDRIQHTGTDKTGIIFIDELPRIE